MAVAIDLLPHFDLTKCAKVVFSRCERRPSSIISQCEKEMAKTPDTVRSRLCYHRKRTGTLPIDGVELSQSAVTMLAFERLLPEDFNTLPRTEQKAVARDAVTRFINDIARARVSGSE